MKKIRKQIEFVVLLCATLIFLQSCVAYQKTNVSLEQAAKIGSKAKVKTKTLRTYHFLRITLEDGTFYGIEKEGKSTIKTPLEANQLTQVRLHDKYLSSFLSIGIPAALVIVFVLLVANSMSFNIDMGGGI